MDKETALKVFYETNEIDPIHVADPLDECYDKRLAELPRRVDQWLLGVEPEDREIFLNLLSKYCYLRRPQCQLRYGQILSLLRDRLSELQLDLSNVLVVTVEAGGPCASGGDNVRSDLRYRNLETLSKNQIIAVQAKLKEEDLATYRAVLRRRNRQWRDNVEFHSTAVQAFSSVVRPAENFLRRHCASKKRD